MQFQDVHELFIHCLKDIYSAEQQLVEALPKMAQGANSPKLKEGFEKHLEETQNQVKRLEEIAGNLGESLEGVECKGMKGLIAEGEELLRAGGEPSVIDAALIGAAQKVEHYEIAAYGTAIALGKLMDHDDEVDLLEDSLKEEKATDEKLTKVAEGEVNPEAQKTVGEMG